MSRVLQIEHLKVVRDGELVLDDICLELEEGLSMALIGPNGAGKSTLIRVILGLLPFQEGSIRVLGREPAELSRSLPGAVGYLPQRSLLRNDFPVSVFDVVMMGAYGRLGLFRHPGRAEKDRVMEGLELVGMHEMADRPIGRLSGGQQQRVLIARSLINQPRLLILDEPTTSIDTGTQEQFYLLLRDLQRRFELAIIQVTHDIAMVPSYCDTIACLNRRLHLHGPIEEVLGSEAFRNIHGCEVEFLFHGQVPHRVVEDHHHD